MDSSFSKISSHELPSEGGVRGVVKVVQGREGMGHRRGGMENYLRAVIRLAFINIAPSGVENPRELT